MQARFSPYPPVSLDGPSESRISICSTPIAVRDALRALFGTGLLRDLAMTERGTAEIVLAEALNNIVEHAYTDASGQIDMTLWLGPSDLMCQIEDEGRPMPGGILPAGRLRALSDHNDLPEGGFGWHLIRALSRDLTYDRTCGRNRLRFCLNVR